MQIHLKGKKALVTGGTSGIGFETAKGLMSLGADVWITGRTEDTLSRAADFLRKDTNGRAVHTVPANFLKLSDAARLSETLPALDILVNNAGVITNTRQMTDDGFEHQWQVNVLAPALLMLKFVEDMPEESRIVNVASGAHKRGQLDIEDVNFTKRRYSGLKAYAQSKLALVMLTRAAAQQDAFRDRHIHAVHPGLVRTHFARDAGALGFFFNLFKPFYISPRRGARGVLHAACSPFMMGRTGTYTVNCREIAPSERACDDAKANAVYNYIKSQLEPWL